MKKLGGAPAKDEVVLLERLQKMKKTKQKITEKIEAEKEKTNQIHLEY